MPILKSRTVKLDIDAISRDVVTVGLKMVTRVFDTGFHRHRKAQCVMAVSGVLTCEADGTIWIVPPQAAVWVPPGIEHRITMAGDVEGYNAFVEPSAARNLPAACCTINATPLLRELIVRTAQYPLDLADGGMESRVASLLLEEIAIAEVGHLHLRMPKDRRLRAVFESITDSPSDRKTLAGWAKRHAMSERTFARLVVAETGMSFGRWRQQLGVILAIQRMAEGASVQQVAGELGYESVGSFVTMFRKALGTSPGRYMAGRTS
ncbi:AraC family transcriptional regulator [Limnoglobus roseus]|uniref:AraC family transcriptional regulator n=1 Tax=Limnoglobus roseus TaxID=2598579 RepID=A0A5C1AFD2_9BACT|nr:helix-turn-helix transcriptional regulator [Limnoglobus roseus]QEL16676.1 AraC family transcriptional regulator [Limnoglobus roseus]